MNPKEEFTRVPMVERANIVEKWRPSDTEEQYQIAKIKFPTNYGPNDIEYRNNNRGYRCDDFDLWENYRYRIVFAGSSDTEGVGLPLEHCWAKVMHKMICDKLGQKIPYWNIAVGGTGTDQMVRYLYHEGNILRPQVVISYLPFLERRERWHNDRWILSSEYTKTDRDAKKLFVDKRYIEYQTEKNFTMISLLMEKWKGIFIYNTNEILYNEQQLMLPRIVKKTVSPVLQDYLDHARDGVHAGPISHRTFAESMFEQSWSIIKEQFDA